MRALEEMGGCLDCTYGTQHLAWIHICIYYMQMHMHKYIHNSTYVLHRCKGWEGLSDMFFLRILFPTTCSKQEANIWCVWSQIIWANGLLSYMIACVWSFEFVPAQAQHHRLPSRRDQSQEEKHLTEMVRQAGMDELIITIASNY